MKISDLKGMKVEVPVTFTLKRVDQATEPGTGLPHFVWNNELNKKEPVIRIVFQLEGVDRAYPRAFVVTTLTESTLEMMSVEDLKQSVGDIALVDVLDAVGKSAQEQVDQALSEQVAEEEEGG